jgi:short-subunit dehydrogenase
MIAHGFIVNGAKVYISSRSADVCDKVAKELTKLGPGECFSIPADLQSLDEVKRLVAELSKRESSKEKKHHSSRCDRTTAMQSQS